jgi:hypothetical protein
LDVEESSSKLPKFTRPKPSGGGETWRIFKKDFLAACLYTKLRGCTRAARPPNLGDGAAAGEVAVRTREQATWGGVNAQPCGLTRVCFKAETSGVLLQYLEAAGGRAAFLATQAEYEKTGAEAALQLTEDTERTKIRGGENPATGFAELDRCTAALVETNADCATRTDLRPGLYLAKLGLVCVSVKGLLKGQGQLTVEKVKRTAVATYEA